MDDEELRSKLAEYGENVTVTAKNRLVLQKKLNHLIAAKSKREREAQRAERESQKQSTPVRSTKKSPARARSSVKPVETKEASNLRNRALNRSRVQYDQFSDSDIDRSPSRSRRSTTFRKSRVSAAVNTTGTLDDTIESDADSFSLTSPHKWKDESSLNRNRIIDDSNGIERITRREEGSVEPAFHYSKLTVVFALVIVAGISIYIYSMYKPCEGNDCGPPLPELLHRITVLSAMRLGDYQCGYNAEKRLFISELDHAALAALELAFEPKYRPLKTFEIYSDNGSNITTKEEVADAYFVTSWVAIKQFRCRISESLSTVTLKMAYVVSSVLLLLVVYAVIKIIAQWRARKKSRMDKIVANILSITQKQAVKYPPYIPITHVRDMVLTENEKSGKSNVWEQAVRYLSCNESRLRTENQIIKGEEYTVWHWVSLIPPEAVEETNDATFHANGNVKAKTSPMKSPVSFGELPRGFEKRNIVPADIIPPTECIKLKNLVCPRKPGGDLDVESMKNSAEELLLSASLKVRSVDVDPTSEEHAVYIFCNNSEQAAQVYKLFAGVLYNQGEVFVKFLRPERYMDRFPHLRHPDMTS